MKEYKYSRTYIVSKDKATEESYLAARDVIENQLEASSAYDFQYILNHDVEGDVWVCGDRVYLSLFINTQDNLLCINVKSDTMNGFSIMDEILLGLPEIVCLSGNDFSWVTDPIGYYSVWKLSYTQACLFCGWCMGSLISKLDCVHYSNENSTGYVFLDRDKSNAVARVIVDLTYCEVTIHNDYKNELDLFKADLISKTVVDKN